MAVDLPDGISAAAANPPPRRANPVPLIVLASLMVLGLAGFLGGHAPGHHRMQSAAAVLDVASPDTLRNGMVFETVIEVKAKQPVKQLVIGISDRLWREMSINTMIPAAEGEKYRDGFRRFAFAGLKPGEVFRFKIDGQINPPLTGDAQGEIVAFDGEEALAAVAIRTRVLP